MLKVTRQHIVMASSYVLVPWGESIPASGITQLSDCVPYNTADPADLESGLGWVGTGWDGQPLSSTCLQFDGGIAWGVYCSDLFPMDVQV